MQTRTAAHKTACAHLSFRSLPYSRLTTDVYARSKNVHRRSSPSNRNTRNVIKAIQVSGPGGPEPQPPVDPQQAQITKELIDSMKQKISEALEAESVNITDVYGDGRHVGIDVVSSVFEGQSAVQRQRMVYKAIWLELQDTVHAVDAMTTKTPEEAA